MTDTNITAANDRLEAAYAAWVAADRAHHYEMKRLKIRFALETYPLAASERASLGATAAEINDAEKALAIAGGAELARLNRAANG